MSTRLGLGMWTAERRNRDERGRIVKRIVNLLRLSDVCTLQVLARGAGGIPECVASRVLKRFALRGLVRNVSAGSWSATSALRFEPSLVECSNFA